MKTKTRVTTETEVLKGWQAIADHLGQPVSTVHRWAESGMPVFRSGRYVAAKPEMLDEWLGREIGSSGAIHVQHAGEQDLVAELQRGLRAVRTKRRK